MWTSKYKIQLVLSSLFKWPINVEIHHGEADLVWVSKQEPLKIAGA